MHNASRLLGVGLVILLVAGCNGGGTADPPRLSALNDRLDALEKRVAAAEQGAAKTEQLRNDTASLDRRLSFLETTVRELATRPATQTTSAPTPTATVTPRAGTGSDAPVTAPQPRLERRADLRALSDEFRRRLAELRSDPGASHEGTREILNWYHEQRRAIRRGKGRTDR
jgi:hypothetical protein